MKRARNLSLISAWHHPKNDYSAYWDILIDPDTFKWRVQVLAYEPVRWEWGGKVTAARPQGFPMPVYPPSPRDVVVAGKALKRVTPAENEAWLKRCSEITDAHPRPVYLLEEQSGEATSEEAGRQASQEWLRSRIHAYRREQALVTLTDEHVADFVKDFDLARAEKRFADCDRIRGLLGSQGIRLKEGENIAYEGATSWERPANGNGAGAVVTLLLAIAAAFFLGADPVELAGFVLMTMGLSTTIRNAQVVAIRDAIDGGSGAGLKRTYDGSRPATGGTATTLLAEETCSDPCAGLPSSGVLTLSSITADSSANATGTATWGRFVDSSATFCGDFSVGTSGADCNLNSTSIASGQQVSTSSAAITAGNA